VSFLAVITSCIGGIYRGSWLNVGFNTDIIISVRPNLLGVVAVVITHKSLTTSILISF